MRQSLKTLTAKLPRAESTPDWFRFENKADDITEVYIYGEIGASWWDDDGTSAQSFADELKTIKSSKITLHLNSPGGKVFDGLAIYNGLKQHPAEVTVIVDALAASAASFIAMAAEPGKLVMARNAIMMIHDAAGVCIGNADDMHQFADLLDKFSDNIADIYTQRAGANVEFWRAAMQEETWYTGTEAVTAGLADDVLQDADEDAEKVAAQWDLSIFNYAGREQAPSPTVIHNRIKSQMRQAKESLVGRTTATTKVKNEGDPSTPVQEPVVDPAEETEETPPLTEETPTAGKDGDGNNLPGTEPTNIAGFSVVINGTKETDPRKVQAHINALETVQAESKTQGRKDFVASLATGPTAKISASQITATEEFALDLNDAQYEKWVQTWNNAPGSSLFASHGEGTSNHDGSGSKPTDQREAKIEELEAIIAFHRQAGKSDAIIETMSSWKQLQQLQSDSAKS